jgi:hypothetical protein
LISEHEFASSFDAFWESLFPLLSPSFIREFNLRSVQRILALGRRGQKSLVQPVRILASREHADVVAELAFELFNQKYSKGEDSQSPILSDDEFEPASKVVLKRFRSLKDSNEIRTLVSSRPVVNEVKALVNVYSAFFATFRSTDRLTFRPQIKGAGILRRVEADVSSTERLVEIKTVNRNLTSHDFRQLLVYLALGLGSNEYQWREAVFFNPRRAVFYSFNVAALVAYLSARNAPEVFEEFLYYLSEREIDLTPIF